MDVNMAVVQKCIAIFQKMRAGFLDLDEGKYLEV